VDLFSSKSSGKTNLYERYLIQNSSPQAKYVRITVYGNTENNWAAITEFRVISKPLPSEPGSTPIPGNPPPKPTEGVVLHGGWGANHDPDTWSVTNMRDKPNVFKVVDNTGRNVATDFTSRETAQSYIDYYKYLKDQPYLPPATSNGGGERTDRTNLSFTAAGYTSEYHLYAAGLDWTKSVGLLLYTDGSGEYGLKHPSSSYLLAGQNGLIAIAKKHNMVLLTPFSPNKDCADGEGSCWYMGNPPGYAKWVEDLVKYVQSQYPIDKKRVAVGGYSSGAQFSTEWWIPSGAAQLTMNDGVIVAIAYGGSPKMKEVSYTQSFKSNVHLNWNVGDRDNAYQNSGKHGAKAGYDYYTAQGFKTSFDLITGQGHGRNGQFGLIMDTQIVKHVPPPTPTTPTQPPGPTQAG
jgi:hypothetical protein